MSSLSFTTFFFGMLQLFTGFSTIVSATTGIATRSSNTHSNKKTQVKSTSTLSSMRTELKYNTIKSEYFLDPTNEQKQESFNHHMRDQKLDFSHRKYFHDIVEDGENNEFCDCPDLDSEHELFFSDDEDEEEAKLERQEEAMYAMIGTMWSNRILPTEALPFPYQDAFSNSYYYAFQQQQATESEYTL